MRRLNRDFDKAGDMYEVALENVFSELDVAKAYLEQLSYELSNCDLGEEEWRKMDRLLIKARNSLDGI